MTTIVSSTGTVCAWTDATAARRSSQRFIENVAITTETVGNRAPSSGPLNRLPPAHWPAPMGGPAARLSPQATRASRTEVLAWCRGSLAALGLGDDRPG